MSVEDTRRQLAEAQRALVSSLVERSRDPAVQLDDKGLTATRNVLERKAARRARRDRTPNWLVRLVGRQ